MDLIVTGRKEGKSRKSLVQRQGENLPSPQGKEGVFGGKAENTRMIGGKKKSVNGRSPRSAERVPGFLGSQGREAKSWGDKYWGIGELLGTNIKQDTTPRKR